MKPPARKLLIVGLPRRQSGMADFQDFHDHDLTVSYHLTLDIAVHLTLVYAISSSHSFQPYKQVCREPKSLIDANYGFMSDAEELALALPSLNTVGQQRGFGIWP
jgi:hypothetical protein